MENEAGDPEPLWGRGRSLFLLTLSYAAVGYFQYLFFYWLHYYFNSVLHMDKTDSRYFAGLPNLAMAACMPIGGWLTDRVVRCRGNASDRRIVPDAATTTRTGSWGSESNSASAPDCSTVVVVPSRSGAACVPRVQAVCAAQVSRIVRLCRVMSPVLPPLRYARAVNSFQSIFFCCTAATRSVNSTHPRDVAATRQILIPVPEKLLSPE